MKAKKVQIKAQIKPQMVFALAILFSCLIGFQNCSKYSFTQASEKNLGLQPFADARLVVDQFTQAAPQMNNKVDILFVLNTTSSQEAAIPNTAAGLNSFISQLPQDADYRISVMPAHSPRAKATSGYLFGYNNKTVLTSASSVSSLQSDLAATLKNMPGVDVSGEGSDEAGLASVFTALDPAHLQANQKLGFFRSDAALAVVFIANEADVCGEQATDPHTDGDWAEAQKVFQMDCVNPAINPKTVLAGLKSLQASRPLLVSGVIFPDQAQQANGHEREYGWGYAETIMAANGCLVATNCTAIIDMNKDAAGISSGLSEIGQLMKQKLSFQYDFLLSQTAAGSIDVQVDGVPAKFSYDANSNMVHIDQPGLTGSKISISYAPVKP